MRARNIKPGFFDNEHLADCEPLARILFAGLWCAADREGRLEDRPKRLKKDILGYDDCDADALLQQLHDKGLIHRYEVDGNKYIWVKEFLKHQRPHVKESPSIIPAPTKVSASTNLGDVEHALNPSSLNPDSLNPESSKYRFAASIIRLSEKDYQAFKKTYHAIPDLDAELLAADRHYLGEKPNNWFYALSQRLNKRHQELLNRLNAPPNGKLKPVEKRIGAIQA